MYTPENSPFEKFRTEKLKGVAMSPDVLELVALAYESGFIDGMSRQAQSSVDRAVNRMAEQVRPTELRRLHEVNQELLEALKTYGAHSSNCDHLILLTSMPPQRKQCSCGLHAAIEKAGEQP